MKKFVLAVGLAAGAFGTAFSGPAQADPVFFQGFETDTSGWSDADDAWFGDVQRVGTGTNGIASSSGSFHAIFTQSGPYNTGCCGLNETGPFTRFDGYRDVFPGTYSASVDIYLDTTWAAGSGFDYSVASNRTTGLHLQDFIFHVTKDTTTGDLLVGGSNNTNFDPREDLESINHYVVTTSGWYTFEHIFRNESGVLVVDLNLLDSFGNWLFTETRIDPSNTIPGLVGGNRYGWFTNIDIDGGIAVDNTLLDIASVPEPGTLAMFGVGLAGLGLLRRRRRAA